MGRRCLGLLLLTCAGPALATNTLPELEQVRADLLDWLPGEYSTAPQLDIERRYGAPPDGEHHDWFRIFARIDAPQIGPHVLYGELRMGGPDGDLVRGTQILYIVRIDETTRTVFANGRRIANAEAFVRAHERPDIWPALQLDERFGGNCDFRWTRHGRQLHGILNHDGTCRITSRVSGKEMSFEAEWVLTPDQLWLFDNNFVHGPGKDDRQLFMGRNDRTHEQLYKVGRYGCELTDGERSERRDIGDRGQPERGWLGEPSLVSTLLRGYRAGPDGVLKEQTRLLLEHHGTSLASSQVDGHPRRITARSMDGWRLDCSRQDARD